MYGYKITREVEILTHGELIIKEGALYPVLHKLEAKELISAEVVKVNNRIRKYYYITEKGKKEKVSLLEDMRSYVNTMKIFLDTKLA